MGGNGMPIIEDPRTLVERRQVANTCIDKMDLGDMPTLVDDMEDTANQAYEGWPDRLYLIGKDGRVAYKGGRGPFGFAPDELEGAIKEELSNLSTEE